MREDVGSNNTRKSNITLLVFYERGIGNKQHN